MLNQKEKNLTDEEERQRMFTARQFTFEEYDSLVVEAKKRRKFTETPLDYNAHTYTSSTDVRLAILFDMLRHLLFKNANSLFDCSQAGFYEWAWEQLEQLKDNSKGIR